MSTLLCPLCVQVHESPLAHEVSISDVVLPAPDAALFGEEPNQFGWPMGMKPIDIAARQREEFAPLSLDD